MTLPPELRRAYERGRALRAALESAPLLGVPLALACGPELHVGRVILACGLPLAFAVARWRGRGWGRGALLGVVAGAPALLAPLCLLRTGVTCGGPECLQSTAWLCAGVGALVGVAIPSLEREPRAQATAAALALAGAALGCWPLGLGVVAGVVLALALGATGALAVRRAVGA